MFDKDLYEYGAAVLNDFSGLEGVKATSHYQKGLVFIPLEYITVFFEFKDTQTYSKLKVGYLKETIFESIITSETIEMVLQIALKVCKDFDTLSNCCPRMGEVINFLFRNHNISSAVSPLNFTFDVNGSSVLINYVEHVCKLNDVYVTGPEFLRKIKELESNPNNYRIPIP